MFSTRSRSSSFPGCLPSGRTRPMLISGLLVISLALSLGTVPAQAESAPSPAVATASPTVPAQSETPATPEAASTPPASTEPPSMPNSTPTSTAEPSPAPASSDVTKYGAYMGIGLSKDASAQQPQGASTPSSRPFTAQPFAATTPAGVLGMDVSGWQADSATHTVSQVNWTNQWRLGARFVYIKATEGNTFRDGSFSSHFSGASAAGMLRGGYHFALPNQSDAVTQANYFVNNGGGWSADGKTMPPLLDIENNPYGATCYGMGQSQLVSWIGAFSKQVQARTGRLPMIYTNYYWWKDCTGNSTAFTNQPLHVAAYGTTDPWIPGGWSNYSVWQYSDSGPFDGDSNTWNGTQASLNAFASKSGTLVPPPVPPVSNPSIVSTADLVAADGSGALWRYPGTGKGGFGPRKQIGQSWTGVRSITVIDWNSDDVLDLLAQRNDGSLRYYRGLAAGGFAAFQTLASSGWAGHQLTVGYWLNSSKYPQILTRSTTGDLSIWTNPAGGSLGTATRFAQGWNGINLSMLDFDGDGKQDLLAQYPDGTLRLARSNGSGAFMNEPRKTIGTGWNAFTSVTVYSDFASPGSNGMIRRTKAGAISYLPVPGNSTFGSQTAISTGWNSYLIAGGENINLTSPPPAAIPNPSIKSAADIVATDSAGALWCYPVANARVGSRTKIGTGFSATKSVHVTDWNADGIQDLLAQWADGRLTLYRGGAAGGFSAVQLSAAGWADKDLTVGYWIKGSKFPSIVSRTPSGDLATYTTANGNSLGSATTISRGLTRTHPVITDFDGDGEADIILRDNLGRLSLYRSNGHGSLISETRKIIASGWNRVTSMSPASGFAATGSRGVLARNDSGTLTYYPLSISQFGTAKTVGTGWNSYRISGSSTLPAEQAITSTSDVLSVDSSGVLWNAAATGAGGIAAPFPIGIGWHGIKRLHAVDWNADGTPDLLAQWINGSVSVYPVARGGGLKSPLKLASSGWQDIDYVPGNWTVGSRFPGLTGVNAAGNIFYWANTDGTTLSSAKNIGQGWNGLRFTMQDFDSDGRQDLLVVNSAGLMRLYRSNGSGGFISEARKTIGSGWQSFTSFVGTTGFAGAGSKGVLTSAPGTHRRYYPIKSGSRWGVAKDL